MNKKDLDALNELYLSVYSEEQLLNEAPLTPEQIKFRNERAQLGVISKGGKFVATGKVDTPNLASPGEFLSNVLTPRNPEKRQQLRAQQLAANLNRGQREVRISRAQDATIAAADKAEKAKADQQRTPAGSPPPRPAAGSPPARPAASGPVLSKKNGVEGTGIGANFKPRAFTDAEKSRYASVAAQNAARTSASSGAAKPAASTSTPSASPKPAIGKLGNTSFERRIPTSAELRAAQAERATQKASGQDTRSVANAEKALQAAQKTNLPTQGPTPAIPDLKSVNTDLAKANSPAVINRLAPAGTAAAAQQAQQKKPPTPGTGAIMQKQSYEWPSAKTIRDIAGAYASIYEAKKKVDQDEDGDNDFADVRIARMIASGMSREQAIAMTKNKSYNKEEIEYVDELYQGRHGQSETEYQDSRSNAGKMVSGTSKLSGAAYSSRGVENTGPNPAGGSKRPRGQGRMTRGQRIEMEYRKANLNREEVELVDEKYMGFKKLKAAIAAKGGVRDPGAVAASIGRKKYGKKKFQKAAATDHKLGEAYEAYEFVASYLLENNFASTVEDANVIINNMSESWFNQIMEG